MNLLFSSCSSVISLQFLLNLSSLLPFLLVVVRFLSPIDGLFAAMMKKRSNFKNCNSNSDPEKVSPHDFRSPQIREILHRNSSMIVINRVSSGFDGYIFGSLSRPPETRSDLLPRCNFAGLVCLQFLKSLSRHIASGYISVDDVVAIWSFSKCGCVLRKMKISLESFQQNLECGIDDGWLVLLLEYLVFTFRTYMQLISREYKKNCLILIYDLCKFTKFRFFVELTTLCCGVVHDLCTVSESTFRHHNLLSQGENSKFAVVICCLDLCEVDCYGFLQLESLVYKIYEKMLMKSGGLQVMAPPELTGFYITKIAAMKRDVCSFEVLLIIVVERLLLFHSCVEAQMRQMKRRSPRNEILFQFHSYVSAHMRLMEQNSPLIDVLEVMLLSCLTKDNSFSSKWPDLHVIIGSQSCVSRQEKIWSRLATLVHEAICIFAVKGLCLQQELFGWLKSFILVVTGCSRLKIGSDVVFALCATLELLLTQILLQPHTTPNPLLYGLDCHGLVVQQSYSSVVGYNEIVVIKTVIIVASISQTISFVCKGLMRLFNDPFPHLVCSLAHSFAAAQDCLQGQSIDIGIIGLRILEHFSPRPREVFMKFSGLMTIGMADYTSTPENFKLLDKCRSEVCKELGIPEEQCEQFLLLLPQL